MLICNPGQDRVDALEEDPSHNLNNRVESRSTLLQGRFNVEVWLMSLSMYIPLFQLRFSFEG